MIIKSLKISEQKRTQTGCGSRVYPLLYLIGILFILPLAGCQDDKISYAEDCEFALALTANTQINTLTRASDLDTLLPEPNINNFKVQVLNPGGKILKEWEHYSEVSNPIKIQTGTFMLKAFYGEQHTGAFDAPYFEGSAEFGVKRSEQTEVAVTCYLANVMVTTSYTDKFKEFFKDYSINIYSSGAPIVYTQDEKRASFFEPGSLTVIANVTKQDGTSFSFAAAQIDKTKAKEYYRFKFDLAGAPGNEKLQVSFDASTIASPITIDISQGWIAGEPPTFLYSGFTNGQQFSNMEGETSPTEIASLIMAPSRIKSCKLTTTSDLLIQAGWPAKEIDLATADADTRVKLKAMGLKWTERLAGLNMAQVNFTDMVPHLPGGASDITHSFTLTTTDDWGQTCIQPLSVSFITASPSFTLHPHNNVWVKTSEMDFSFTMTKGKIEQIKLDYNNGKDDLWVPLTFLVNPVSTEDYKLTAQVNFTSPNAKIRAIYGSGKSSEITFNVINPKLQIEQLGLPFAKRTSLNLSETDGDFLFDNLVKEDIRVEVSTAGQWESKPFEIVKGSSSADPIRFNINDLKDNSQQQIRIVYNGGIGDANSNVIDFKTEEIFQIPNAGFEEWTTTTIENVSQGGRQVSQSFFGQNTWSNAPTIPVSVQEPGEPENVWQTLNSMTANPSSSPLNTWYVVPSTLRSTNAHNGSYAACIRNVGWHDNGGNVPDNSPKWNSSPGTPNAPTNLKYTAGRLFLGHNATEGTSFKSRPVGLKFYYKYIPKPNSNDKGVVYISIKAEDGSILATNQQNISAQTNFESLTVNLGYNELQKKAATLCISFISSNEESVKTTNDMSNFFSIGSELYIDDIELVY